MRSGIESGGRGSGGGAGGRGLMAPGSGDESAAGDKGVTAH